MPVAIDQVESEVTVEGGHGAGHSGESSPRNLPEPAALQRWRASERQVRWDAERTSAVDYQSME